MPMALRPGTTATRAESALIERAMSSARPITRDDLMPGAGSSSYSVTTGPGRALMISPRTPKSPQHAFERARVVLAVRLGLERWRVRSPSARPAGPSGGSTNPPRLARRGARRAPSCAARGGGVLVLVVLLLVVGFRLVLRRKRRRGAAARSAARRSSAAARRRRARDASGRPAPRSAGSRAAP